MQIVPSLTSFSRRLLAVLLGLGLATRTAWAHDDVAAAGWNTEPHILLGLFLSAVIYARGVGVLWAKAGVGRGVARWQAAAFAAGWLVLVVALVSPLDALSEVLSSAHMVQHLALMLGAAPLLMLGAPAFAALWALPGPWRRRVARRWRRATRLRETWLVLSQPLVVWALYFLVLWVWHLPALYEAALRHPLLHDLQHLLFLGGAALLWWVVFSPMGRLRLGRGAGVLYLFTTSLHAMALGVFMTLAPRPWYGFYADTTPALGLSPLEDQQIAGAIMWMPAGLVYVALAALIFTYWLRETETATARIERLAAGYDAGEFDRTLAQAEEV